MKRKHYLLLLSALQFLLILVYSCRNGSDEDLIIIRGQLDNSRGETLYLEELGIKDLVAIDSVKLSPEGTFEFRVHGSEPMFYVLKQSSGNFITLLAISGEEMEIEGSIEELARTYRVKNSPGSELLWQMDSAKRTVFDRFDSLVVLWNQNQNAPNNIEIRNHLDSVSTEILKEHKRWLEKKMEDNPTSLSNLVAIWQTIGRRQLFTLEEDEVVFERVQQRLISVYPNHSHAIDLNNRVLEFKKLKAEKVLVEASLDSGKVFPVIKLPDPGMQLRSIDEFRGKNVLVYFWDSRTTQSYFDTKELSELHRRYQPKGFEVYQVSVDPDAKIWQSTLNVYKPTHLQVMGNDQVVRMFNLEKLPRAFLVDTSGVIISKDISMESLSLKLIQMYPRRAI